MAVVAEESRLMDRAGREVGSSDGDLFNHCMRLFYRARDERRPLVQKWLRNYKILHNQTYSPLRESWRPAPSPPEVKPIVAALVAWLTDTEPIFNALPAAAPLSPYYEFYDELATDLRMALQAGWQHGGVDSEVERVIWDGYTYGIGVIKTTWDPSMHRGLGDFSVRRVDPFTFYPDPNARSMDDATFFVEVRTMPAQELERRWPGSLAKMNYGEQYRTNTDHAPTRTQPGTSPQAPMSNPGAIAPATIPNWGLPGQSRESVVEDPGVTVFEFWLRTPTTGPAPVPGPDAQPSNPDDERTYDAWRCVVIAGNRVLLDEPAEAFWSHGQHPYDRYVPEDTGEMVGDSLVELLTPLQLSVNKTLASIEQNIDLMGNPVALESQRAGLPRTKITNRPGQRLPINGDVNNSFRWLDPPQMHPNIANMLVQFYIGRMGAISGLSAIVRGATPTGRNAQGVLDSVSEAAFVRVRLALRNLERCLISAGNKAASNVCEFYNSPRIVALVGPSGERAATALNTTHFYVPTAEGRVPLNFQVNVDLGSQQATSRQARAQDAVQMFTIGLIDGEAALEIINMPGWKDIAARMREYQAQSGTLGQPVGARQRAGRTT